MLARVLSDLAGDTTSMAARLLDGKAVAKQVEEEVAAEASAFLSCTGVQPTLAAVLVGDNPASTVYVHHKQAACQRVGIRSRLYQLSGESSLEILQLIDQLNQDPAVHGILVQLPLPAPIARDQILDALHPLKDVDGFHPENVGLLAQGRPRFVPCTPAGIVRLLRHYQLEVEGRHVVVVGRSDIVGKPMALLLAQRTGPWGASYANATVTICHTRTKNLADLTRSADILVVAAGQPRFISADMIKPKAVVIDVGIHRIDNRLVGDVDGEAIREIAGYLTPVPGGVGPMTVAMLLANTVRAAQLLNPT